MSGSEELLNPADYYIVEPRDEWPKHRCLIIKCPYEKCNYDGATTKDQEVITDIRIVRAIKKLFKIPESAPTVKPFFQCPLNPKHKYTIKKGIIKTWHEVTKDG